MLKIIAKLCLGKDLKDRVGRLEVEICRCTTLCNVSKHSEAAGRRMPNLPVPGVCDPAVVSRALDTHTR